MAASSHFLRISRRKDVSLQNWYYYLFIFFFTLLFFFIFRRAEASTRRARGACPPTIVHAVPPPDTPRNYQPITAFGVHGDSRSYINSHENKRQQLNSTKTIVLKANNNSASFNRFKLVEEIMKSYIAFPVDKSRVNNIADVLLLKVVIKVKS